MIESIELQPSGKPSKKFEWALKVPALKNRKIRFTPGVNILFGPNGSGKSTIAGLCAHLLAAEQGGVSKVTETWLRDLFESAGSWDAGVPVAKLEHDGQPVMYVNSRAEVGMACNGAAFDFDFLSEGVGSIFSRRQSSGEASFSKVSKILDVIMKDQEMSPSSQDVQPKKRGRGTKKEQPVPSSSGFPTEISFVLNPKTLNGTWASRMSNAEKILKGSIPKGMRTIIMDEPESGFSLPWQAGFWNNVMNSAKAKNFQIIIATHSPFALALSDANFIEMEPGYVDSCRRHLVDLGAMLISADMLKEKTK